MRDQLDFAGVIQNGGTTTITSEIDATAALRGRVGYAMDRTMIYAAAGLAWIDYSIAQGDGATVSNSYTDLGWTVGVGIEHAFTDRLVGRIDFRYSDFGDISRNAAEWDLSTSEIRVGLAMHF